MLHIFSQYDSLRKTSCKTEALLRWRVVRLRWTALWATTKHSQEVLSDLLHDRRATHTRESQLISGLVAATPTKTVVVPHTLGGQDVPLIEEYDECEADTDDTADAEEMGSFIAPMSRPAWVPNDSSTVCSMCKHAFSLTNRRHHCRSCGNLVDSACTVKRPLPHLGYPAPVFVCKSCIVRLYST
jgi:growth factor-regulated tyrosine kinase substrate